MSRARPIDVARARAETPGAGQRIHLNSCGASLMPQCVLDVVIGHLHQEAHIGGYEAEREAADAVRGVYDSIARMLGAASEEIAIVENATRAWDMAFYAFSFEPGDRILTSVSEYASNFIACLQVARRRGARIEVVPDDESGQLDVAALERMIDPRVRLVAVTHVPTHGGLVNPAAEIGRVARSHGIPVLLDACQSVGQMPIDVEALQVDILTATSRKFLRGPRGVGFLYVRQSLAELLEPPFLDLHAAKRTGPHHYEMHPGARRFETWESNVAAVLGLGTAVDYALGWGLDAIQQRVCTLAEGLRAQLAELPGVVVRDRGEQRCGLVTLTAEGHEPADLAAGLSERGINVSVSPAQSARLDMRAGGLPALLRAGVHYYNTEDELSAFALALGEILHGSD